MGKKKCTYIPAMQCGDRILTDNYDKAEEFNKAFLKFATIDTSNLQVFQTLHIKLIPD